MVFPECDLSTQPGRRRVINSLALVPCGTLVPGVDAVGGRARAELSTGWREPWRSWLDSDATAPPSSPPPSRGAQFFSQRILRGWFITFEYSCDRRRLQNPPLSPQQQINRRLPAQKPGEVSRRASPRFIKLLAVLKTSARFGWEPGQPGRPVTCC